MTFEEWLDWNKFEDSGDTPTKQAWNYQQRRIDELNECLEQALSELEYWQDKANTLEYDKTGV